MADLLRRAPHRALRANELYTDAALFVFAGPAGVAAGTYLAIVGSGHGASSATARWALCGGAAAYLGTLCAVDPPATGRRLATSRGLVAIAAVVLGLAGGSLAPMPVVVLVGVVVAELAFELASGAGERGTLARTTS